MWNGAGFQLLVNDDDDDAAAGRGVQVMADSSHQIMSYAEGKSIRSSRAWNSAMAATAIGVPCLPCGQG